MRRACLILTLSVGLIRITALAAPGAAQQGDAAYQRKAYSEAAGSYRQALGSDSANALLWYKMGNAQYRLRHTGEAAFAYAKALSIQPAFPEAAGNLDLIQQQVRPGGGNQVFFLRWWSALTRPAATNIWAVLAILCFSVPLITIAWLRYKKRTGRAIPPQLTGIGISLGLLFAILAVAAARGQKPQHKAIVMQQDAAAKPTAGKAEKVVLPEGLVVDVLRTGPSEILIELPDGREGLMQRSDIALVE
jgi:tetratricopeptide (TPR) repeat protein